MERDDSSGRTKWIRFNGRLALLDADAGPHPGQVDSIQGCAEEFSSEWIE
jgi:hypothetical protein